MNVKKHPVIRAVTIALLFVLILLTFLSRTIASYGLPAVQAVTYSPMEIQKLFKCTGRADYADSEEVYLALPADLLSVAVKKGSSVKEGDLLCELDVRELNIQDKNNYLEILRIQNALAAEGLAAGLKAELEVQLSIAAAQRTIFREKYPLDGLVKAPCSGVVKQVHVKSKRQVQGLLFTIVPENSPLYCVFSLPASDAQVFYSGFEAQLSFTENTNINGEEKSVMRYISAAVNENTFNENTGLYQYSIPLENTKISYGQELSVKLVRQSPVYEKTVPSEAVFQSGQKSYVYILCERDGVFGKESYVKKIFVEKLDENGTYTAIESNLISITDKIVIDFDKEIQDGQAVRVLQA